MYNTYLNNFILENIELNYESRNQIMDLSESQKLEFTDSLVSKLYSNAVEKYNVIDYGDIPSSKGSIDKLRDYKTIESTLDILNQLQSKYGVKCPELDEVNQALKYVKFYEKKFNIGFVHDVQFVQMIYNNIVVSIIASLSLIITTYIDYVRTPTGDFQTIFTAVSITKPLNTTLMDGLNKFNKSCANGDMTKVFDSVLKKENFLGIISTVGAATAMAATALVVLIAAIAFVRELTYFVYDMRMKTSNMLLQQAEFLELNVTELSNSSAKNKNEIIKKQQQSIAKLKKMSDKIRVKFDNAETNSSKALASRQNFDDIKNGAISNSVGMSLF